MAYCGKCGTKINGGRFCPKCGNQVNDFLKNESYSLPVTTSHKISIGFFCSICALGISFLLVLSIMLSTHLVNKPCDYCGRTPSIAYKTSDDSMAYVCRDCSKECMLCHKKATKHYENLIGTMVFVCNDCYEEVSNY